MIRRLVVRGLIALIIGSALSTVASTSAQAATAECSDWSASLPGLRYRDCIVYQRLEEKAGSELRTGLQVINATATDRWVRLVQRTIVSGFVVHTAVCEAKVQPGNNAVATCWAPGGGEMIFVWADNYAYGSGDVTDLSTARTRLKVSSPIHHTTWCAACD
jgi:hypothetical protein